MASNAGRHEPAGDGTLLDRTVPIVVKADVQGSLEAVRDAVATLTSDAVRLQAIHTGVGPVTLSDVALAVPSGAVIVAFNVKLSGDAEAEAKARGVTVLMRRVIYELMEDVAAIVEGATPRELKQVIVGTADVVATFRVSVKTGKVNKRMIAGCRVTDGVLRSGLAFRVVRGEKVIAEGTCDSLRRSKLDVDLVGNGAECGVGVEGFDDFQAGDVLHCIEQR
jgi:translation initiation factor IF-2